MCQIVQKQCKFPYRSLNHLNAAIYRWRSKVQFLLWHHSSMGIYRISLMHDASRLLLRGARVTIHVDNDLCSFRFRFEEHVVVVVVETKQSILLALKTECKMNEFSIRCVASCLTCCYGSPFGECVRFVASSKSKFPRN